MKRLGCPVLHMCVYQGDWTPQFFISLEVLTPQCCIYLGDYRLSSVAYHEQTWLLSDAYTGETGLPTVAYTYWGDWTPQCFIRKGD